MTNCINTHHQSVLYCFIAPLIYEGMFFRQIPTLAYHKKKEGSKKYIFFEPSFWPILLSF